MRKLMLVVFFALAGPVRAEWPAVALEVLVDEADLIVVGKVTKVQDGGFFTIGPNKSDHIVKHDAAIVEISAILKGGPQFGKAKVVQIGQKAPGNLTTADATFEVGQEGIWLLKKSADPHKIVVMKEGMLVVEQERNVYWAKHPGQLRSEKERQKVTDLIEARAKVAGGKAVNGLVARAELLEMAGRFQVRLSVKNVSAKPITICAWAGKRPVQVRWRGPDGNVLKSRHYAWLEDTTIESSPLPTSSFSTIQPGGVGFIAPPLVFQASPDAGRSANVAQPGQHRVTVSFSNKETGGQFGLENVWTGTVSANEVSFTAK